MKFQIPTFEFIIDDSVEAGVKAISIVTDPAFQSKAIFFENNKPKFVSFSDKKKQIVAGLSLIPDVLVYRIDPETKEEYNGFFSKETIEKIVEKFHDEQQGKNVNLQHDPRLTINAFLIEDYIVNTDARVEDLKLKGIEHPNIMGAWFTTYKIKDPEVFEAIINGGDNVGFSVESFLDKVMVDFNREVKNNIISDKLKVEMKKNNKNLKEKILAIFASESFERTLVPELAFEIEWGNVGEPVNKVVVDEKGVETLQPVGKGEFVTEEGIIVVDEQSNLVEVRELPAEPVVETPEAPASGSTSGSTSGDTLQTEVVVEEVIAPTGVTETVTGTTGQTAMRGIDKSILEVVGNQSGEFTILVRVDSKGNVVEAKLQSMSDLLFSNQEHQIALAKIIELEAKIQEPIGDPILTPEVKVLTPAEFNKLSAYEKLMHNKGIKAV